MLRRCLVAFVLAGFAPGAWSAGLDLNFNNDAARISGDFDLSNNLIVDGSLFYHQDNGNILGAGLHLTGDASGGQSPVRAGLGGRLYYIDSDTRAKDSGSALPLGGFVEYTFPEFDRFSIGGTVHYAPGVLSFGDVDDYLEYQVWGGYSVLRDGIVYLGYRRIEAGFDGTPDVTFDSGVHIGLKLRF
jgi:hypothetical protein